MNDLGNSDFRLIIAALMAGIFIVLAILLRSVVAPFYLLATVLASYAATMGVTVAVFQGLLGAAGLPFYLPPFLFVILVALGADYNIFIISRIREEADAGHTITEATARGLVLTGPVITSAGLILAGTFGALVLAPLPDLRQIGFAVAFGVLLDTFLVRSILVPATTVLLGRWAFWPSVPGEARTAPRRLHIGYAAAGIATFTAVLAAVALTGGTAPAITLVAATRPTGPTAAVTTTPTTATAGPRSETPAAATASTTTPPSAAQTSPPKATPTGGGATATTVPRAAPATTRPGAATSTPSPPATITAPKPGPWSYRQVGTRRVGAAGSDQPFDETAATNVTRTGGDDANPQIELSTSTSNGDRRETRTYRAREILLTATEVKSSGMGFAGTLQPPPQLLRWPAAKGDAWQSSWTTGNVQGSTQSKVSGVRDVATPAGTFRCTDVASTTTFSGAVQGTQEQTSCWVADLGMSVVAHTRYRGTYNNIPFDITTEATLTAHP